ncbi:flotillin family protein [Desertifilum sp. FACHB-1129]|uniref:Flotillin n=2 Tax=Desertifilum TaxID=1185872 RepID=A0A1E5QIH8_9CYAN|nr:flotillin family protein [Desertifilum tharense]MBD2312601.1 flotillin family protein [Desertifilum sp. FACHB-1129]MBD2320499.1 flotillin family protein [Desertifilum sp. FACHB-866]MBD2330627.1 flotillin family protein [Desertifilum sp. FACHB-868]OEJ74428.1 flotillin [Desertifilum tharense IPPAS B-1220]
MSKFYTEQSTQPLASMPQPVLGQLSPGLLFFPGLIGALVFLLLLSVWAYTRVYVITPNNEAFVRTGGVFIKEKKVILDGGCIVLPGFHELTRVPLREISIDVERTGKLAVRTQDYLRANMRVTFYVCIIADKQDVLTSAARLSRQGKISSDDIKEALEKRADDAIRAAAKNKTLAEIDSDKIGFADAVVNLIQQDLKKVGLTLNNIAISEIEEGDTYDTNNFFDTQGVRLRTETIQRSIQQKREVELTTQVAIEQKELDARKRSLSIAQEQESATLAQQLEVESLRAQREREIQETRDKEAAKIERNKILQNQAVEEEKINQQLAVQQSKIQADIELEERQKQLKVAQIVQRQEAEIAEISRQKQVESSRLEAQIQVAEAERLSKIAQQEAAIAIAQKERDRLASEAEKAQAEAAVTTAQQIEEAERQQRLSAIAAQQEAQKRRIADQNVVELEVFRRRRQAEIARQAAELEAESIRTLAQANRDRALAEAQGQRAIIEAENAISDAKLNARLISELWPQLSEHLPEIVKALAPQPGVLGDARIYAFPGANGNNGNGNGIGDLNKLLMSTSGLTLINSLLEEGKLGGLLRQVTQSVRSGNSTAENLAQMLAPPAPTPAIAHPQSPPEMPPPPPLTANSEKSDRSLEP